MRGRWVVGLFFMAVPMAWGVQQGAEISTVAELQARFDEAYTNEEQAILYPVFSTDSVFQITLGAVSFSTNLFQGWISSGWPSLEMASGITGYPVFFREQVVSNDRVRILTGLNEFPLCCWTNNWDVGSWIRSAYGETPYWENTNEWMAVRDPSRLLYSATLIPVEMYDAWMAWITPTSAAYGLNNTVPEDCSNNLYIVTCPGQTPPFRLYLPSGSTHADIFSTPELIAAEWALKNTLYNPGPYSQVFINESLEHEYLQAADADADSDGDTLSDAREDLIYGTRADLADTDSDGILDGVEILTYGLDPLNADCDGDGVSDGAEVHSGCGLNPRSADTDGDGIRDGDEDTDGDGMPNLIEVMYGLKPFQNDAIEDLDGDGYPNIYEYKNGSHPAATNSQPQATRYCTPQTAGGIQQAINAVTNAYGIIKLAAGTYIGSSNRCLTLLQNPVLMNP